MLPRLFTIVFIAAALAACGPAAEPATTSSPQPAAPTIAPTISQPSPTAVAESVTPVAHPTATQAASQPSPVASTPTVPAAQETAPALVVDQQTTANPRLVQTQLQVPSGFEFPAQEVALPPSFSISLLAAGLSRPRFMAFDEAGSLLVADQGGSVYRYSAMNGAIAPSSTPPVPILTRLNAPSSLAFHGGYLYVGETNRISRVKYSPTGSLGQLEVVVPNLPTGGHSTRTVAFGPDDKLYVSVGSSCNICRESDERRAAILRYNPDGTGYELFATGLRNAVGLAFQPGTGLLWATVNERDNQGDEIPPDLVTIVRQGEFFGWPACIPPDAKPQSPGNDCSHVTPPTVGVQAHSAPLGLTFYAGSTFPAEYHGDIFVAQHGSWNRQPPAAPQILRIHLENGRPISAEDFATGWQLQNGSRWGRPAGVIQAPDGSLIVSDDSAGVLYRIAYQG